jgi:hypothetical protein
VWNADTQLDAREPGLSLWGHIQERQSECSGHDLTVRR